MHHNSKISSKKRRSTIYKYTSRTKAHGQIKSRKIEIYSRIDIKTEDKVFPVKARIKIQGIESSISLQSFQIK